MKLKNELTRMLGINCDMISVTHPDARHIAAYKQCVLTSFI
jgi:hypothetical protein